MAEAVDQLTSGSMVAVHLSCRDLSIENAVEPLRGFCGPVDPDMCRHVVPQSLRARFGIDQARNAVHCTDLEEDAQLEVHRIFQIS